MLELGMLLELGMFLDGIVSGGEFVDPSGARS